jgi:redox-sensitive bicupin YhaK (pirin superfamily)
MSTRRIHFIRRSRPTIEGAGVHLKRGFGFGEVPEFDPFLMLDDFHTSTPSEYLPGFPWHPHRGIETVTYLLHGVVEHGDSMGNKGVIRGGDVQWMTAGSGVIHQEMPRESPSGTMWGFQLWTNLPSAKKMMPPRYRDVRSVDIPEITAGGSARVMIVSGSVEGTRGAVRDIVTDPTFLDVVVAANGTFSLPVTPGHTVCAYVLDGEGFFDERREPFAHHRFGAGWSDLARPCACTPETVVLYEREGDRIVVTTEKRPCRFLLLAGKPLNEPIAWYGPIVMNTQEELRTAFEEYEQGTFVK